MQKRTAMLAGLCVAIAGLLPMDIAHADTRTQPQGAGTVKVTSKVVSADLNAHVKKLAGMLGIKIKHPSKKLWLLTGTARQIQQFQRMAGGLGLTLGAK